MSKKELDLNFIRKQFPSFSIPENAQWAFFENAGGSYMPKQVIDATNYFMNNLRIQPYSRYSMSVDAEQALEKSYKRLAELHNVMPSEILLGPSTSMNTFILARAFAKDLKKGDEIIVTNQEHEANAGSWWRLADEGIVIKEWQIDPETGLLPMEALDNLLSERTKLICVTHCSNVAAAINDVKKIGEKAHKIGAKILVDGVSYAPHKIVDFKALDIDFYLYSLYKTYGPHQGLLYIKQKNLEGISTQGHVFNENNMRFKMDPAGPNYLEVATASAMVDYYETVYNHHFEEEISLPKKAVALNKLFLVHEEKVANIIVDYLLSNKRIQLIGMQHADLTKRSPTLAFRHHDKTSAEIVDALIERKIATNNSHFYAYRLIKSLGIDLNDGVVRLSLVHYTSIEDAKRAVSALEEILS